MRPFLTPFVCLLCVATAAAEDDVVTRLVKKIKGGKLADRARAPQDLAALGPGARAAVPDLADALKDGNADVRRYASYALGKIGKDAGPAVKALAELLKD